MDTIETNEPVGVDNITPSSDTSVNDTQPEETGEVTGTETDESGQAEVTLLAGKYKSAEELEKAYNEVQQLNGQLSQKAQLANMLEKQTGMNAQQLQEYISQQEQAQTQQRIANDPSGYALERVGQLEAQLALKEEQTKLDGFIAQNPEYAPFKDKILNLGLNLEQDKDYADIAREYFGKARAQGQQDAYKKIDTKVMTQATGASKGSPRARITPEELDSMSHKDRIAAMEAMYPHADTSNRPY
jgi:hypothetical protein